MTREMRLETNHQTLRASYSSFSDYLFLRNGVFKVRIISPWLFIFVLLPVFIVLGLSPYAASGGLFGFFIADVLPFLLTYSVIWVLGFLTRRKLYASRIDLSLRDGRVSKFIPWSEVKSITRSDFGTLKLRTSQKSYDMFAKGRNMISIIEYANSRIAEIRV